MGFSIALLVTLTVQGLKSLGLPESKAAMAALVCAVLYTGLALLVAQVPASEVYVKGFVSAIVVFLAATGIYHVGGDVADNMKGMLGK